MLIRQSLRRKPPFGEIGDPPLGQDGHILYEEELCPASSKARRSEQRPPKEKKEEQRITRLASKKELADADFVERLIIGNNLWWFRFFFFFSLSLSPSFYRALRTRTFLIKP